MLNGVLRRSFVLGVMLLYSACGGASTPSVTSDFDLPTAMTLGGAVLSSPRVQPVYFAGFPYSQEIDTFLGRLQAASYWQTVGAEYGVGAVSVLPGYSPSVTVPAAVTPDDLPGLLGQALQAMQTTDGSPPIRSDTIYALFFDPNTTISIMGVTLCGTGHPSGFHDEWQLGSVKVPVAVVPTCAMSDSDPGLTGADILTPSLSHELIEAATDPYVRSDPAYLAVDDNHALWAEALSGAEVGDLCENEVPSVIALPELGFPVQRIWSNSSAHAGTGPCVPVPAGEKYFNGQASLPNQVMLDNGAGGTVTLPALNAPAGQNVLAHVSLHTDHADTASAQVFALEFDDPKSTIRSDPTRVVARVGQTVPVPVTPSVASKTGLVPLVIGAFRTGTLHLWVGGINRL